MYKNITQIALKRVAVAMGVAIIVTSTLNPLDSTAAIPMLGLGMAALALESFIE